MIRASSLLQLGVPALLFSHCALAGPSISDSFVRTSAGETLTVPFTSSAGEETVRSYGALVEVFASGTGNSFGLNQNDAFFCSLAADERCSAPGVVLDSQYYQLNIGMAGLPFAGGEANNIDQFITFIDDVGPVPPGTLPPFDAQGHVYHFVVHLPASEPSKLSFGVSDGIYFDNDGSFTIQVYDILASPLPEPSNALLMGLGLLLLVGLRLTRACTRQSKAALRLLPPAGDAQR